MYGRSVNSTYATTLMTSRADIAWWKGFICGLAYSHRIVIDRDSELQNDTRRDASSLWCQTPGDWQNVSLHGSSIIQSRSRYEDSGSNEPEQ